MTGSDAVRVGERGPPKGGRSARRGSRRDAGTGGMKSRRTCRAVGIRIDACSACVTIFQFLVDNDGPCTGSKAGLRSIRDVADHCSRRHHLLRVPACHPGRAAHALRTSGPDAAGYDLPGRSQLLHRLSSVPIPRQSRLLRAPVGDPAGHGKHASISAVRPLWYQDTCPPPRCSRDLLRVALRDRRRTAQARAENQPRIGNRGNCQRFIEHSRGVRQTVRLLQRPHRVAAVEVPHRRYARREENPLRSTRILPEIGPRLGKGRRSTIRS